MNQVVDAQWQQSLMHPCAQLPGSLLQPLLVRSHCECVKQSEATPPQLLLMYSGIICSVQVILQAQNEHPC